MNRYLAASAALAFFSTVIVAASGCSAPAEEDLETAYGAATPPSPSGNYALAESCSRLFKRHAAVHDVDLELGTIRWGVADVPGVTDPDLGQEYCEYKAVQAGKIIKKPSDMVAGAGKLSCVFTSVFKDASGVDAKLLSEMAKPENLGATSTASVVRMQFGFNTRGAATQLLADCSRAPAATTATTRARTAACFLEAAKGGPNAAQLTTICKANLNDASKWAEAQALGVSVKEAGHPEYEPQQDIASCMAVTQGGASWRNSDPMICSRTSRAANECSCKFQSVPSSLNGFPLTGWVDDNIPSSCRLAKVDNADYPFIAICDVTEQEVADLPLNPTYNRSVQTFCRDRFGVDLVMKLPLRALQRPSTCQTTAEFCDRYMGDEESPNAGGEPGVEPGTEGTTSPRVEGAPPPPVTEPAGGSTH
ncbi:MAG: hypothetical protein KIT84_31140 [Labilithrix sp.]|nr:hypothetical protein [Labilithrix sp.]MCW5815524.1 hypothetical protein [Labilithrix sp.]